MLAYDWNFLGLSTETKPTAGEKVVDGSTFYECDTSTFFIYYKGEWYQQTFVTEDGINFWLYKTLMKKMFGKLFDSNITKSKIIKPTTGTEIEFTNSLPAQITDLTGYGDTTQQTYSGKNLFLCPNISSATGITRTRLGDNSFQAVVNSTDNNKYTQINYTLSPNTTYFLSVNIDISGDSITHTGSIRPQIEGSYLGWFNEGFSFTTGESGIVNFLFYNYSNNTDGETIDNIVTWSNIQIEAGSTATSYEPYVGGIASPNPSYPQTINVVAGEQTVTINESQTYTIDLGSIELCKIGTYQDYIYKNGDDWYIHKEVGEVILTGASAEGWSLSSSGNFFLTSAYSDVIMVNSDVVAPIMSNYYVATTRNSLVNATVDYGIGVNYNSSRLYIRNKDIATPNAFQTWLESHNTTVYYALETPTNTKITDATLISNLNSLVSYIFPAGDHQIVITADDLPMKLKLTITEKE